MKIKKIFAILLCCSTLLSTGIPVFASEKPDNNVNKVTLTSTAKTSDVKDLQSLRDKYELKHVSVLPEGIIPLKFDSIEDADKYLSKVKADYNAEIEKEVKNKQEINKKTPDSSSITLDAVASHSETHMADGELGSSGLSLNITCKYKTDGSTIIGVSSISSSLDGNDSNYEWKQTSSSWTSLDAGETANVKATGKLTQYLWVNGGWESYYNTYTRSSEFYS